LKTTVLGILFSGLLIAATPPLHAEQYKIGIVNPNALVESSPQYEDVRKDLEAEFDRRNQDLISKQKQLKKLEDKLATDGAVMSTDEVQRLEQDIRTHRRNLNRVRDEYREDLNLRRTEEFNKLLKQVSEVVHQVAEQENFDIILSQGVVYASKRVDMTKNVLDRLIEQYKQNKK
jgi:outer membrane protein